MNVEGFMLKMMNFIGAAPAGSGLRDDINNMLHWLVDNEVCLYSKTLPPGGQVVKVVAGGDGSGRRVVGAAVVAVEGRWRGGEGERDAKPVADEELDLDIGERGGGGDVVRGEEEVGERGGSVADAGASCVGEGGGG